MDANDMKKETLKIIDNRLEMYSKDRDAAYKKGNMITYAALGMLIAELKIIRCDIEEVPV